MFLFYNLQKYLGGKCKTGKGIIERTPPNPHNCVKDN